MARLGSGLIVRLGSKLLNKSVSGLIGAFMVGSGNGLELGFRMKQCDVANQDFGRCRTEAFDMAHGWVQERVSDRTHFRFNGDNLWCIWWQIKEAVLKQTGRHLDGYLCWEVYNNAD